MTRTRTWIGAALAAALLAGAALAAPPTIAPDEIRPGMTGYGLSVFSGTAIDTFGVTVIGVQPNVRVRGSMILIEVSGHGLEQSSIAQGMSGSPVYIEGRLAGALAFGWSGSLRPIAGVTPIGEMLAMPGPEAAPGDQQTGALGAAALPVDLAGAVDPALASALGLPPAGGVEIATAFPADSSWPSPAALAAALLPVTADGGSWICRPAGSGAAAGGGGAAGALAPGGACAVPLVMGDALLGAVGTVTWVEDGRAWMFGHPFMQRGPVDLPLASAEILAVLPSREMSFKMGSIGGVVGAVRRDQRAGLVGLLGAEAPTVPVAVSVARGGAVADYAFTVAADPLLLPALVFWSAYNALLAEGDDASLQTVRLVARTRWDAPGALGDDGLQITALASGPGGAAQLGAQLMAPLRILLNNPYREAKLASVDIRLAAEPVLANARITGLTGPARLPAAGGPVTFAVEIEPRRGERQTLPVTIEVPAGLADQPYRVVAASAAELFALEAQRAAGIFEPDGFGPTVRLLDRERSPGTVSVVLFAPGSGVVVGGQELAALPGSVARTVRRGAEADQRTLADAVARTDTATSWIISGHALQDVRAGRALEPLTVERRP